LSLRAEISSPGFGRCPGRGRRPAGRVGLHSALRLAHAFGSPSTRPLPAASHMRSCTGWTSRAKSSMRMASHRPPLPLRDSMPRHRQTEPIEVHAPSRARRRLARLNPVSVSHVPALPDLDVARIHRYCDSRVPARLSDVARVEATHRSTNVTSTTDHPWHPELKGWSRVPSRNSATTPNASTGRSTTPTATAASKATTSSTPVPSTSSSKRSTTAPPASSGTKSQHHRRRRSLHHHNAGRHR
jgi:hypothetical protein